MAMYVHTYGSKFALSLVYLAKEEKVSIINDNLQRILFFTCAREYIYICLHMWTTQVAFGFSVSRLFPGLSFFCISIFLFFFLWNTKNII